MKAQKINPIALFIGLTVAILLINMFHNRNSNSENAADKKEPTHKSQELDSNN